MKAKAATKAEVQRAVVAADVAIKQAIDSTDVWSTPDLDMALHWIEEAKFRLLALQLDRAAFAAKNAEHYAAWIPLPKKERHPSR